MYLMMLYIHVDYKQRRVHWYAEVSEDGLQTGRGVAAAIRAQGTNARIQENETTA